MEGFKLIVNLNQKIYKKGISLTKKEMKKMETHLEHNPNLPKWGILIRPY